MFSFQTKQSVNRKHSHGSKALPPGVVKYLCQGAVCDDPSPTPSFQPMTTWGPCPVAQGHAGQSKPAQEAVCLVVHFTTVQQN